MLDAIAAALMWQTIPDLEAVTLLLRTFASTANGSDSFAAYTLYHAKRKPATRQQLQSAGIELSDESIVFDLYNDDMVNAGIPNPQPFASYLLFDQTAGSYVGNLTSGNNVVSGVASTAGLLPGMGVVGNGIASGSTIQSVDASTVTLTQPATSSLAGTTLTIGFAWKVASMDRNITKAKWTLTCSKAR